MRTVKEIMENTDDIDSLEELFDIPEAGMLEVYNKMVDDWKSAVAGHRSEVEVAAGMLIGILGVEEFSSIELLRMVFLARWLRESGKQQIMRGIEMIFE